MGLGGPFAAIGIWIACTLFSPPQDNESPTSQHGGSVEASSPTDNSARMGAHCLDCHAESNPGLLAQWKKSRHFKADVGCADCHGTDHSRIFTSRGRVSAGVCAKCHEKAYHEFMNSKHSEAAKRLRSSVLFQGQPEAAREVACLRCHRVGLENDDGSVGRCNYCHSGHLFSVEEARRPEACALCHVGPDYPQWESYERSKHGILFHVTHDENVAPTCVTCHMPGGTHDDSFNLTIGTALNGGVMAGRSAPVRMDVVSQEDFRARREKMIQVCARCHSIRFSQDSLAAADAVKQEGDVFLGEAAEIIRALHKDGLLSSNRLNSGSDPDSSIVSASPDPQGIVLGPEQIFEKGSAIERAFYEMFRFHYSQVFKGAYHHAPTIANRESFPNLKQDLALIREMAEECRRKSSDK